MKADCVICRGSGVIRLAIYRRTRIGDFNTESIADAEPIAEESSRSYPCPECSDRLPQERLAVVQYHSLLDSEINDPEYVRHAKHVAAHELVAGLLKNGFIRFERGPNDARDLQFPMMATIGVVSLKTVATLEQRIAERQDELAREVVSEAAKQIRIWRSAYTGDDGTIHKGQAVDSIQAALTRVLAKRSSMHTI